MDDTVLSIQSIRKIAYMCKFWHQQSRHLHSAVVIPWLPRMCVRVETGMISDAYGGR